MRLSLIIFFLYAGCSALTAQMVNGITGVRDTSFNLAGELAKVRKNYPEAGLPEQVKPGRVMKQENRVYCSRDGFNLLLDVFSPSNAGNQPRPALIIIHGGGWRSGSRMMYHAMAESLALLGYVAITPDYRLSTEALFPAAVNDLKAVVKWLKLNAGTLGIDTLKIVAVGHSAGGELASFLGATNGSGKYESGICSTGPASSTVQAVVNIDGIVAFIHPESGEGDDSKRTSAATYWLGFSKTENPALWVEAGPLCHAGAHTPPFLFLNSMVARMHAGRDDFTGILNRLGIYSRVKTYDNAPHSFCLFEPWFTPVVNDIDDFLKKVFNR